MQYDAHVRLYHLWLEYQMRPIEQVRMFHIWADAYALRYKNWINA